MGMDRTHAEEVMASTTRQALSWNHQGKRRRDRARNNWHQDLLADTKRVSITWNQLQYKQMYRIGGSGGLLCMAYTLGGVIGLSE